MKKLFRRMRLVLFLMLLLTCAASVPASAAARLNLSRLTMTAGKTFTLKMKGLSKAKAKKVKWKSSKKKVAKVSKKGKVTALKAGKTTITAKVGGKSYKCKVVVMAVKTVEKEVTTTAQKGEIETVIVDNTEVKSPQLTVSSMSSGLSTREKAVLNTLLSFKTSYPEGKYFTNATYYEWKGGIYRGGFGCAAFAFMLSDAAFGTNESIMHENWDNIRVGDILRVDYNTHSVIVLQVTASYVIVAEANYNKSVHWGRKIPISELKESGSNIITRYDTTSYTVADALNRAKSLPVLRDIDFYCK